MSTGKRLAKRSIIGTRVAAPGHDGKYYTGSIHALKSPASAPGELGLTITPDTRYVIRFDQTPGARNPDSTREYQHKFIIGPGFGLVSSTTLVPGQKVYLTYNGREINAEVIQHRKELEEVDVSFAPSGQEGTMTLTRRIEEIRLLESRKSARLADQDTDFARLADMGGDRKRASSHSIEVPHVLGSRKRRPSTSSEYEKSYSGAGSASSSSGSGNPGTSEAGIPHRCARAGCGGYSDGSDCMDECAAALVLMSLSCSPHSPHGLPLQCQRSYGSWAEQSTTAPMVGSPGAGASSSSSSGASWRTGTPSPSLSEEGVPTNGSVWPLPAQQQTQQQQHQLAYPGIVSGLPFEGTPNGALDEGIVPDYLVDMHPQKKKIRSRNNRVVENNSPTNRKKLYKCNWRGCGKIKATCHLIEDHVRQAHLRKPRGLKAESKDEEFYYDELTLDHVSSPPTMSHRDMARPPHEDPEYQKLLRLEAAPPPVATSSGSVLSVGDAAMEQKCAQQHLDEDHQEDQRQMLHIQQQQQHQQQQHQQQQQQQQQPKADEASALTVQLIEQLQHRFPQKGTGAAAKQLKLSPRPLPTNGQAQNIRLVAFQSGKVTTRKSRSDTKKCRKVYGMTNREQWCTQCKWKKACTRFGE